MQSAREARDEAARLKHLQRHDWFDTNVHAMDIVLREKFYQHEYLRTMLADTGDRELIEDSPVSAKLFAEGIRNVSLMASSNRLMHSGDVVTMGVEGMS